PTGELHFGSLVSAVASYLDAKANHGLWLVRIDDLDPPRELKGSSKKILQQLEAHGLYSDKEVLYQSQRNKAYLSAITKLKKNNLIFRCYCSRKELKGKTSIHNYPCQSKNPTALYSLRLKIKDNVDVMFSDLYQGEQRQQIKKEVGDIIVLRKEKIFSYNLAVVVDDAFQQVSHVIRGSDLLKATPGQIYLQKSLELKTPIYGHIPIVVDDDGIKLSKQNLAATLDHRAPQNNLIEAINWLGLEVPIELLEANSPKQILPWAIDSWRRYSVKSIKKKSIQI
ncbi:MAG: tRNA glutamyl-Q(34) synthetase GluQRS, partial [Porticoccus sp.]|nr:tRNA glutamyl-Q(34) synthetase GluQRS [Porticoccus sp.]